MKYEKNKRSWFILTRDLRKNQPFPHHQNQYIGVAVS